MHHPELEDRFSIESFTEFSQENLALLLDIETAVFEKPRTQEVVEKRLSAVADLLILVGFVADQPVAYKVGYGAAPGSAFFYSWIGGVLPEARRRGYATRLLSMQHQWALQRGYKFVRTHTKNKYRGMLLLNIRHGFDVVGTVQKSNEVQQTIVLEKRLATRQSSF